MANDITKDTSLNDGMTAIPKDITQVGEIGVDADLVATTMDYGTMNEADARESGYTDAEGHAVDMAKPDVKGEPTGAFTDIGAGRSSVVHKEKH